MRVRLFRQMYKVTITEKGRKRVVPTLEAVLLRLRLDSLDGKPSAIDRLMKFLPTVQAAVEAEIQLQRDQKEHAREDEVDTIIRMARHIVTAGPDEEFEC